MHSGEPVCKKLLLFAGEWPNQLKLSSDALDLCTALLLATLVPDPAGDADVGIWTAVDNLITPLSGQDTTEAREGIIKMATTCALNYAKEHPYLLGLNVALTVVGFAPAVVTGPFLGMLGFGATGVRAGWVSIYCSRLFVFHPFRIQLDTNKSGTAAAGWQSVLGAVPKGSLFSACQSIAATGSAPVVSGFSWAISAGSTGFGMLRAAGRR